MTISGKTNSVYLSVVIPVYNEQNNIKILLALLAENINPLHIKYEIIIIDDGSNDDTWLEINEAIKSSKHIKGIKLSRNFGHQHALLAGLNHAKGKAIISMDGDLQHPPSVIPEMVEMHKNGHLVVNTFRNDTEVSSFFKRKSSSLFYKIFSFLTEVPMMAGSSDFRLIDRIVLNQLLKFKDIDLFIRGSVEWLGFSSITLPYTANKRYSGTSKYNLLKMLKFAGGSVVSFSTKPLVIGIWIGIFTSIIAFIEIFYVLSQVIQGNTVPGWASTIGAISFLFGILFIILGIIGIYLSRIFIALQNRPRYIIQNVNEKDDTQQTP